MEIFFISIIILPLTCYGISNIVVFSYLFEGFRSFFMKINPKFLGELFSCILCFGTWVGLGMSALVIFTGHPELSPFSLLGFNPYLATFLGGCYISGFIWLIHTIQEAAERHGTK